MKDKMDSLMKNIRWTKSPKIKTLRANAAELYSGVGRGEKEVNKEGLISLGLLHPTGMRG